MNILVKVSAICCLSSLTYHCANAKWHELCTLNENLTSVQNCYNATNSELLDENTCATMAADVKKDTQSAYTCKFLSLPPDPLQNRHNVSHLCTYQAIGENGALCSYMPIALCETLSYCTIKEYWVPR